VTEQASEDKSNPTKSFLLACESLHGAFLGSTTDQACQLASAILAKFLDLKRVVIIDQNAPGPKIIGLFGWGLIDERIRDLFGHLASSKAAKQALDERRAVFVSDVWADESALAEEDDRQGMQAMLFCPLIIANRNTGIVIADQGGADFSFTNEQLVLAQALACQMAIALEYNRVRAESAARVSSLTIKAAEYESRLGESINRLRIIMDLLPAMVFEVDRQLAVRLANAKGASFYGLQPSWMTGWQMEELTTFVRDHGWGVNRVLASGQPCHVSCLPVVAESGVLDYLDVDYLPVRNGQGDLEGVAIYAFDVTQNVWHDSPSGRAIRAIPRRL